MAEIIKFSEASEEKKEASGKKTVKKKIWKRRFGRLYRFLLILSLVAAAITAYFVYEKTKIYSEYTLIQSVDRVYAEGNSIIDFNGHIMTFGKDGANAVDSNGKLLWNQTFDMQYPMSSICDDVAAFADYGGSNIYIQNENGDTKIIPTDMPIRKISVASDGYVVAILEDIDVTWIYLYDMNGKVVAYFRTTMEKSGYPVDIDISPNGELVCVSYYYLDCNEIRSSVAFFNFGPVGQNNIDNYVSGYNYSDSLVPMVRFFDNASAFAVSEERLSVYQGEHKPVSVSDMFITSEIYSVYYDDDVIGIVYKNTGKETRYRLELYNTSGEKLSEKEFDFDFSGVNFGNGNVILYGDTDLYIGTYSGDIKYEGTYNNPIQLVLPTVTAYKYIIVTEDTIDTVEFN